jgi:hypothetical protein
VYDCAAGARYSRDQPFQQPGDLSDSPPRPIAEVGARCESPAGAEPAPKHPLGDAVHAVGPAEWLLHGAEEVLGGVRQEAGHLWRKASGGLPKAAQRARGQGEQVDGEEASGRRERRRRRRRLQE